MKRHLHNLFFPHHGNNHRAKILHHSFLSKLIIFLVCVQAALTFIARTKPGVLGYASNITVDAVLSLTNERRVSQGLSPLKFNATLADSARQKAAHMFANNYWAHTAPDGTSPWSFFKNVDYNYLYAGENLARDFGDSSAVVQAWMDSPTHRDNIMSGRYEEIGIAVVNGLLFGQETTLVVQHFGKQASAVASVPPQTAPQEAQAASPEVAVEEKIATAPQNKPAEVLVVEQETPGEENILPQSIVPATLSEVKTLPNPVVSAFDLTKSVNLAITILIILVLMLDAFLIWQRKTERRAGKSFVHLSLFVLVALALILTSSGKII